MILGGARASRPRSRAAESLELAAPVCCLHACAARVYAGVIGITGGVIGITGGVIGITGCVIGITGGVIGIMGGVIGRRVGHCLYDGSLDSSSRFQEACYSFTIWTDVPRPVAANLQSTIAIPQK